MSTQDVETLLKKIVGLCREVFGENLTGVYLHGSLAMGCFQPEKSDIDFLVVLPKPAKREQKEKFLRELISFNDAAPEKGLEMSVVLEQNCRSFVYPTPFEVHFSVTHLDWYRSDPEDYITKMQGTDKDLAAHFMVTRERGRVLWGAPIREVFAPVPEWAYEDSILSDIADAEETVAKDPVYILLNLCRVLGWFQERKVMSKEEGGIWGISHLPREYRGMLETALKSYRTGNVYPGNGEQERKFCAFMAGRLKKCS